MKKITLYTLVLTSVFLSGCFDSHQYNKDTDKECLTDIKNGGNPSEILLKALRGDASPSVIKKTIESGGDPNVTVGKSHIPIVVYAKSPKAVKIILDEIGDGEIKSDKIGRTPLFFYGTKDLCEAYIDGIVDNTQMGVYTNMLTEKEFEVTPDSVKSSLLKTTDKYKRTPLFYAQNREIIDYWISNGKNINSMDSYGKNPLLFQLGNNSYYNADIIAYFIEKGSSVNVGLENGNITPLGEVLRSQRGKNIFDLLVSKGAKLENSKNTSNLFYYVTSPEQIKFLKDNNLSPDIETTNGFSVKIPNCELTDIGYVWDNKAIVKSPLAKAVVDSNSKIVEALLNAGANAATAYININNKDVSVLRYSLFISKNIEITNFLLAHNASMCKDINTIFSDIIEHNNNIDNDILFKLLKTNPDVLKTTNGIKLFKNFLKNNNSDYLKELISLGFNINGKNTEGKFVWEDLLCFGSFMDEYDSKKLELLLNLGLDVNLKNSSGRTLLERAVYNDDIIKKIPLEVWKSIVDKTRNLNEKIDNKTIISYLVDSGCSEDKIEYYLEKGGKLNNANGENIIWDMFSSWVKKHSDNIILTIIRHSDNFDKKVNGKTIIIHALEEKRSVSLEIIKALSKKMKSPTQSGSYGIMSENISPIELARKLKRDDIKQYLMSLKSNIYTKDNVLKIKNFYIGMTVDEALKTWQALRIDEPLLCDYDKDTKKVHAIRFKDNALRKMFSIPADMSIERFVKEFQSAYDLGDFSESYGNDDSSFMNISSSSESTIFKNESEDGLLIEIIETKTESTMITDDLNMFKSKPSTSWTLTMKKIPTKKEMSQRFN